MKASLVLVIVLAVLGIALLIVAATVPPSSDADSPSEAEENHARMQELKEGWNQPLGMLDGLGSGLLGLSVGAAGVSVLSRWKK